MKITSVIFPLFTLMVASTQAFTIPSTFGVPRFTSSSKLFATEEVKVAKQVTGEELEMMMAEWDMPLVVDAYATW
jgi:hypothetical protein